MMSLMLEMECDHCGYQPPFEPIPYDAQDIPVRVHKFRKNLRDEGCVLADGRAFCSEECHDLYYASSNCD